MNRLHVADFRDPDLAPISNLIDATSLTAAEIQGANQEEVYRAIKSRIGISWERFVEKIFHLRGERGDKFNLKFYFGSSISHQSLLENASDHLRDDQDIEDLYDSSLRNSLIDIRERSDEIVDLRFVVPDEKFPSQSGDSDSIPTFEHEYAEVRVYTKLGAVAISRRVMDGDDITKLRQLVEAWSDGEMEPDPQLTPNQMLALENAMDGTNVGIHYGDFKGGRSIKRARYTGASNLNPLSSEIVKPASLNGRIVKLKFEHQHSVENHSWDVKTSLSYKCTVTATKETTPDCIDKMVHELVNIRQHTDLLRTVTDRLDEYRWDITSQNPAGSVQTYLNRRNLALRTAVDSHIGNSQIETVEIQMFRDLFFNLGIELLKTEQIKEEPNGSIPDGPEHQEHLNKLFEDYARFHLEDPNYNSDRLWTQLHDLLTSEFSSPIDLIETAESEFEI